MTRFEINDQTANIGLKAYGRTLEELFLHTALGLFSVMADTTTIQPMASIPILAQADDLDGLLVAWLNELLSAGHRDRLLFMNCQVYQVIAEPSTVGVNGQVTGEVFDPERHGRLRGIQRVVRQGATVRREGDLWMASACFEL